MGNDASCYHIPVNGDPLSLYLHIPFCSLKCAYCDFTPYAALDALVEPYCDALISEIRLWSCALQGTTSVGRGPSPDGLPPVPTVFFGGGTPSLLPLAQIERIMAALRESFALDP